MQIIFKSFAVAYKKNRDEEEYQKYADDELKNEDLPDTRIAFEKD